MRGGEYILTGLAHNRNSKIAYDSVSNQEGMNMRSRKFAALLATMKPPEIHGDPTGDRRPRASAGPESIVGTPAIPVPDGAWAEKDFCGIQESDDRRDQLQ
jgi:hypothetical protein